LHDVPRANNINIFTEEVDFAHLVGKPAAEAVSAVQAALPEVTNVQVVPPDTFVTMDYRTDRARVYVDEAGQVTNVVRG
jgi:hypothetical protein